ncbi:hypothetical protein LTR56_010613 [Elasticomyces elasticus]|nr:hypothetical protein LTR56_010613 [Elasticomyces elasticus]KAK5760170.1 hypothetical protein LTS12_009725 [Elasticomyces elasticus]
MSNITEDESGVIWLKWETESDLIATRLEKLATQFFQAHEHITDPSAVTFIRSICCSSFQMLDCIDHDGPLPTSGTIDEHILDSQAFTRAYPEFTVKVINATADVDVDCKHAVVWVTIGGSNVSQEQEARLVVLESAGHTYGVMADLNSAFKAWTQCASKGSSVREDESGVVWLKWETEHELAAAHLEELASQLLRAHEYDPSSATFIRTHCSSVFEMLDFNADDGIFCTIDEHIAKVEAFKKAYPDFKVTVINATADIDIECRHAVVWATMGGGGVSKERTKAEHNKFWAKRRIYEDAGWPEAFDAAEFRRKRDEWNQRHSDVTDLYRYGPQAARYWGLQHGQGLRDMFNTSAGRYAV